MNKIIIIGSAYPLRGGGLATFNERLARQCQSEGNDVVIYTFTLQYPNFLFPGKTQYSKYPPPDDLKIIEAINSINPFNWIVSGFKIKKENADIVIVRYWLPFMGPCLGTILRIVSQNKHTKIIGIIDNVLPHEKRPGDYIFTKYFLNALDGFVTMSQYVKNELSKFTKKEIRLVQHPLYDNFGEKISKDEARIKLALPLQGYIFLFFGFIRKYKGLDILISALEHISQLENFYLLIAGEFYSDEKDIIHQIKMSPMADHIISRTNFIQDEEVALYFSAADCVVQPYRHATQSGVTPLAYHFEVPMVVTNVGALPDLVPEALGKVCQPTPESIATAMNEMFRFDIKAFDINIKKEKKKLSWEKLTAEISEVANKIELEK